MCVKTLQIAIVSTLLIAMTLAEPPANQYLPPQARNSPSRNYGPPARTPSRSYSAPQQQNRNFAPRTNYGPPAAQQQPSTSYGLPSAQQQPSTSYGLPSAQDFNNFDSQRGNSYQQAPSSSYGVPSASDASFSAPGYSSGPSAGGYTNGGYEEPAKYEFQYDVQDELAGLDFGHKEQREGSVATGRYYVLLPDGRKQVNKCKQKIFFAINLNKSTSLLSSRLKGCKLHC